ncbi:hypothetical protein S245_008447 [Arachis hypogaea]
MIKICRVGKRCQEGSRSTLSIWVGKIDLLIFVDRGAEDERSNGVIRSNERLFGRKLECVQYIDTPAKQKASGKLKLLDSMFMELKAKS